MIVLHFKNIMGDYTQAEYMIKQYINKCLQTEELTYTIRVKLFNWSFQVVVVFVEILMSRMSKIM